MAASFTGLLSSSPALAAWLAPLREAGLGDALPERLSHVVVAALVHVPATWVLASLAMLLFGRAPRPAAAAAWGLLGLFAVQVSLWEAGAIARPWLNPLAYTHPMIAPNALHLLALVLVAGGLLAAGGLAFRARDVR